MEIKVHTVTFAAPGHGGYHVIVAHGEDVDFEHFHKFEFYTGTANHAEYHSALRLAEKMRLAELTQGHFESSPHWKLAVSYRREEDGSYTETRTWAHAA